jgi:hypothetical protein
MNKNVKIWVGVPDGSSLLVNATGTNEDTVVIVMIHGQDGTVKMWRSADVNPGPAEFVVRKPYVYAIRIDVEAGAQNPSEVSVTARVVDPDGDPVGSKFRFKTAAKTGSYLATVGIVAAGEA